MWATERIKRIQCSFQTIQAFYNDTYIYRFKEPVGKSLLNLLWAITISIYLVGGMVGIFSSGYFADKFGRRNALQLSHIFAVLAAIFFGMARPTGLFELIIVGRLIIGFSTGNIFVYFLFLLVILAFRYTNDKF